jgi:DNA-binding transcriptional LysR family regulator
MIFDFDMVDLRLLVNVVDTLSLTRGAERSNMSAPAASARIRKMEEALGKQLFYRTTQGLAPTSAGRTVLRHALLILRQVQELTGELLENAGDMRGNLRLYANTLSINEFLPAALQKFLLNFPGMNIDLHERPSADIARALKQGAADIGILSADVPNDGLECMPYRTERLVLVTSCSHPLAGRAAVHFGQTLEADYIGLKDDTALQSFVMRAAYREGLAMKLRIQVNNFEALCRLVDSGVGIGVIPESVARRHAERLRIAIVVLQDEWAVRDLKIAVREMRSLPAPARALIEVLVAPAA